MLRKLSFTSLLLAFVFFLSIRVDLAHAQQLSLSLPNLMGQAGQVVVANMSFTNNGEAASANFDILFDSNVADILNPVTDVTAGPALTDHTVAALSIAGGVRVIVVPPLIIPQPLIPDGNIVTMNFTINGAAQGGDQTNLTFDMVSFGDQDGMVIPDVPNLTDGSITVEAVPPPPPGEVNVTIVKDSDTNRVDPGVPVLITYNIILNSTGDEDATDVGVTDTLPQGSEFQPDMSSGECEIVIGIPNTVGCDVGTIPAGQERVLNITISITREEGDDILNQAIVEFLNAIGQPVENQSNTFTIRVGGGGW